MAHKLRVRGPTGVLLLMILACALARGPAHAQEVPTLAVDVARPLAAPQESLLMLDRGGAVLPLLSPRFSLAVMGGHHLVLYTGDGGRQVSLDEAVTAVVGAALGLGIADIGVAFPVHLALVGQTDRVPWTESAVGDLVLVPRVAAIPVADSPVQIVLSAPVTFPCGKEQRFAGRPGLTAEPRFRFSLHVDRFHLALRPGLLLQGGTSAAPTYLANAGTLRAAVGVGLGPGQVVRPELGLDGVLPLGDPALASLEVLGGVVVRPVGGLGISFHGGFGAGPMPGIAAARVVGSVSWELPERAPANGGP